MVRQLTPFLTHPLYRLLYRKCQLERIHLGSGNQRFGNIHVYHRIRRVQVDSSLSPNPRLLSAPKPASNA